MPPRARCFLLLVLSATTILLIVNPPPINEKDKFSFDNVNSSTTRGVVAFKKVVAYSLMKRTEIDSREVVCEKIHVKNNVKKFRYKDWMQISQSNFFLSGAYLDNRLAPHRYIRIVGMFKGLKNENFFCQFPTESSYIITRASRTDIWLNTWNEPNENTFNPVLLSCFIPSTILPSPSYIYLSSNSCIVSNERILIYQSPVKRNFITICVKPLDFTEDVSSKLMQWIEINKILGVDRFNINVKKVHRKTLDLLKFYQKKFKDNFILNEFTSLPQTICDNLPCTSLNLKLRIWQKRRDELITYNNCLYQSVETSQFILPLDIDEVIIPKTSYDFEQLFAKLLPEDLEQFSSFSVQNAYFLETFSTDNDRENAEPFLFRYKTRSELSPGGESGKSFINTNNTLTVFNHYALDLLKPGSKRIFFMSRESVQMNHYKKSCSIDLLPECVKYLFGSVRVFDAVTEKYRKQFSSSYAQVRQEFFDFLQAKT